MTTIYGPVVSPAMVEREVVAILKAWSPAYLDEIARQVRGNAQALQPVKRWRRISRFPTEIPDEQLPLAATVSNGTAETPFRNGRAYDTWVVIEHGILVAGGGPDAEEDASDLADDYGIAHALLLLQKAAQTSALISQVLWRGYNPSVRFSQDETYAATVHTFWVHVEGTLRVWGGPDTPPADPTQPISDLGTVQEVDLTVTSEALA